MIGMGLIDVSEEKENGLTIKTDIGYNLNQVLEENIEHCYDWGYLECMTFMDEGYYYFSNWHGSDGGRYNEKMGIIIPSSDIDDMDDKDFIEAYGMDKEGAENLEFVEEPLIRELDGLHVENENGKYGPLVIKDSDGLNYKCGQGIYKFRHGHFYKVVLK